MGNLWSETIVRQKLSNSLNNTTVNEIMDSYTTIFHASNEISFHNVGNIKIGNVKQSTIIKNAVFVKRIIDITNKYKEFYKIEGELDKILKNSGMFANTNSTTQLENYMSNYVDNTTLMQVRFDIINSFNVENIIKVSNDKFDASTSFTADDIDQSNQVYNQQLYEAYLTLLKDTDVQAFDKFKAKEKGTNEGLTADMFMWIALGIGGVAVIVIASQFRKK